MLCDSLVNASVARFAYNLSHSFTLSSARRHTLKRFQVRADWMTASSPFIERAWWQLTAGSDWHLYDPGPNKEIPSRFAYLLATIRIHLNDTGGSDPNHCGKFVVVIGSERIKTGINSSTLADC